MSEPSELAKKTADGWWKAYSKHHPWPDLAAAIQSALDAHALEVAEEWREKCAKACDGERIVSGSIGPLMDAGFSMCAEYLAKKIRALPLVESEKEEHGDKPA